MAEDSEDLAKEARACARKFRLQAWAWRAAEIVISIAYWFVSKEPYAERFIMVLIAALSVQALVATYDGKAEASEAKAAGYENP